jgi:hypothetical protein
MRQRVKRSWSASRSVSAQSLRDPDGTRAVDGQSLAAVVITPADTAASGTRRKDRFSARISGRRDPNAGRGDREPPQSPLRRVPASVTLGRRRPSSSEEVAMDWNKSIRQLHRWLSIIFTACVIANFAVMGRGQIAFWVGASTLVPLALLLLTGLYLFALPYTVKWRRRAVME